MTHFSPRPLLPARRRAPRRFPRAARRAGRVRRRRRRRRQRGRGRRGKRRRGRRGRRRGHRGAEPGSACASTTPRSRPSCWSSTSRRRSRSSARTAPSRSRSSTWTPPSCSGTRSSRSRTRWDRREGTTSADPRHNCSLTASSARASGWRGHPPEFALVRLLSMTPANANVTGTSPEGLQEIFEENPGTFASTSPMSSPTASLLDLAVQPDPDGRAQQPDGPLRADTQAHPRPPAAAARHAPGHRQSRWREDALWTSHEALFDLQPLSEKLRTQRDHPGVLVRDDEDVHDERAMSSCPTSRCASSPSRACAGSRGSISRRAAATCSSGTATRRSGSTSPTRRSSRSAASLTTPTIDIASRCASRPPR